MVAAIDAASEDGVSAAIATCSDAGEGADLSAGSGLSPDTSEDIVAAAAAGVDATMGAGVSVGAAIGAGATVATAADASPDAEAGSSTRA